MVTEANFNIGIDLLQQFIDNDDFKISSEKHIRNLKKYLEVIGTSTWKSQLNTDHLSSIIDSAIKEEPDAAYLLNAKAVVEMKKKNWNEAIILLNSSLEKSPGWLMPKYYLGICFANIKNYKKALEYYEQVLEKDYYLYLCKRFNL